MASTAEKCACGMDYKKGTSVCAAVFCVLSLICIIITGVGLYEVIIHKDDPDIQDKTLVDVVIGVFIFTLVLHGLHTLSCALVIVAAKTGNRFLLIPWMLLGCIMAAITFRSLWTGLRVLIITGNNLPGSKSFATSPVFQIVVNVFIITLLFCFGGCVCKLFRVLRTERTQRNQQNFTVFPSYGIQSQEFGFESSPLLLPRYDAKAPLVKSSPYYSAPTDYKQMPPPPYTA